MNQMFALFRGALTLNDQTFIDLKASPDVFRKGFIFLLVIGLVVGLVLGVVGIVQGFLGNPAKDIADARQQIEQMMGSFIPVEGSREFLENFRMGFAIAERIVREVKTPLPQPFGTIFKNIGLIVSQPFSWLSMILLQGMLVHIVAKLLGGRGTIAQMLGLTSLTVAPRLLDALGFIPCLGSILSFIGWVWSIPIYVKATAQSQELTMGKAVVAVFAPLFITILLVLLFGCMLFAMASFGSRG